MLAKVFVNFGAIRQNISDSMRWELELVVINVPIFRIFFSSYLFFTLYNPLQCSQPTGKGLGNGSRLQVTLAWVHYERPTEKGPP